MKKQTLIEWLEEFCLQLDEPEKPIFRTDYSQGVADGASDAQKLIAQKIRHAIEQEKTRLTMYETVSEGTPVTPPFATKEELVNYLVEHGDFWDQHRGHGGWSRENAEHFVQAEWAPSGIFIVSPEGKGEYKAPRDGA